MGMNDDLARRVRDYARGQGRAAVNVSSAWLAREFRVDSRTVAAALRPFGIRPAVVERGVRGYVVVELAAIRFDDDDRAADIDRLRTAFDMPERPAGSRQSVDAAEFGDILRAEANAISRLSAGAGHDMTPALKAAGLL